MNFSSLIRTFNRLSLPKKLVVGLAAIAGGGALICIPLLSLRPPSPSTVLNEDAYYKSRIGDRSPASGNTTPNQDATALDTSNPPNLPPLSSEPANIPGLDSSSSESSTTIDATDTPSEFSQNSQNSLNDPAGNALGTASRRNNLANGKAGVGRYTSPDSLANSPYRVSSPGSSSINTPYSLPNPGITSSSANPYSLQPGAGNSFNDLNPFSQSDAGTTNSPNATGAPGRTPMISGGSAIAPNNLNGPSGDVVTPNAPSNPGGNFTAPSAPNYPNGNFNTPGSATSSTGTANP
jgi:hypothetical protein